MAGRINSIDAKITINASQAKSELARITSDINKFNKAFQGGSTQLQSFSKGVDVTSTKLVGLKSNIDALNNSFSALARFGNMMKTALGGAYEYSTMMESNAIGISGILKSMVTLDGKTLEWNQAMRMSTSIMGKLRTEALQTSATSKDLIETFRALLGPGLGAGMKIDEIIKFTKVGVNAVRSMGLPTNQYIQELRGLEQGGIRASSSTLATALGLTDKDIKAAKASTEGLYKFLMRRMEGFEASTSENAKTVVGRIAILQEGVYSAMQEGGKNLYSQFSDWLKKISDKIYIIDEKTKELSLNPEFVASVKSVFGELETAASLLGVAFDGISGNAGAITKALSNFAMVKVLGAIVNSANASLTSGISKVYGYYQTVKGFFSAENVVTTESIYENIRNIFIEMDKVNAENQDMDNFLKSISTGVMNLAQYYSSLGVNAEQAAEMQKRVVDAIKSGKSYDEIDAIKKENEVVAQEARRLEYEEKRAAIEEKISNYRSKELIELQGINDKEQEKLRTKEAQIQKDQQALELKRQQVALSIRKEMDNNLVDSANEAKSRLADLNKRDNVYNNREYTASSLLNLENRLLQLGMNREQAEERIAGIRETILSLNGRHVDEMTAIANQEAAIAENDARELGIRNHIAETRERELSDMDRAIAALVREREEEEARARAAERVNELLHGRYVNRSRNANGDETETVWGQGTTQYQRAQEMNSALLGAGIDTATRDRLISHYMNVVARNGDAGDRVAEATIQQAANFANAMETANAYSVVLENVTLSTDKYAEAERNLRIDMRSLEIDAMNNINTFYALGKEEQEASKVILDAWSKLSSYQTAGFGNEEKRMNTLIALQKELSAGNMEIAFQFSRNYLDALETNAQRNVPEEIDNNEAVVKLRSKIEQEQASLKTIQEEAAQARRELSQKTTDQINKQTLAMNDLTKAYQMNEHLVQETIALSPQEINALDREILFHEAKSNVIKNGNNKSQLSINALITKIKQEADAMEKAGLKGSEGYNTLIEALKRLSTASQKEIDKVVEDLHKLTNELDNAGKEAKSVGKNIVTAIGNVGVALGGLGMAYQSVTQDTESCIGKFAEWAIQASTVISAAESIIPALESLRKMYIAVAESALIAKIAQHPAIAAGAVITAAAGYGIYQGYKYNKKYNEVAQKYGKDVAEQTMDPAYLLENATGLPQSPEEVALINSMQDRVSLKKFLAQGSTDINTEMQLQALEDKANESSLKNTNKLDGKIDTKYPPGAGDNKSKTDKAAKEAEKAAKKLSDAMASYQKLGETINIANGELTYSYTEFDKQLDESKKKALEWGKTLKDAIVNSGGKLNENGELESYGKIGKEAYDKMTEAIQRYISLKERDVELQKRSKEISNSLQHNQNIYDLGETTQEQLINVNRNILEEKKKLIEEEMILYQNNATKRVELEKQLADTVKAIRDNDMYDMRTAWKAALTEISLQQVNFGEGIKSVFSNIQSAGVTLLSSTASFSEKVASFFESITQSILDNMAKIIMQGLITNAIMNVFGLGKVGGINLNSNTSLMPSNTVGYSGATSGVSVFAKGGYASGWSIVGEEGPELVNFSNPGRVYTAQQTANALSNAGGNVNIKIDLKNESGQQMQAEATGTSFDGESYIVGVVLKAISTNKNGIRTVLRGV